MSCGMPECLMGEHCQCSPGCHCVCCNSSRYPLPTVLRFYADLAERTEAAENMDAIAHAYRKLAPALTRAANRAGQSLLAALIVRGVMKEGTTE